MMAMPDRWDGVSARARLSVVIPLHNEEEAVAQLVSEIRSVFAATDLLHEVILVDDGSADETLARAQRSSRADPRVRVLHFDARQGQSAALDAGFRVATGNVIGTMDGDLQNDPRDLLSLMALLDQADVVNGIRARRRDGWNRKLVSRIANRLRAAVLGDRVTDIGCSLRVFRSEFVSGLRLGKGWHRFLPVLLSWNGARSIEAPVNHRPRPYGDSHYATWSRLWRGSIDLLGMMWLRVNWPRCRAVEVAGAGLRKGDSRTGVDEPRLAPLEATRRG